MGKLTMNAGIVNFDPENPENSLVTLNFRYPKGTSAEELQAKVQTTVGETVTATQGDRNQEPHYVPVDDPLVATLLQVYEDHTGEKARTNHWWRYLWPLIETWCCLWRNVPWLHRHNAPSQRIYGIR